MAKNEVRKRREVKASEPWRPSEEIEFEQAMWERLVDAVVDRLSGVMPCPDRKLYRGAGITREEATAWLEKHKYRREITSLISGESSMDYEGELVGVAVGEAVNAMVRGELGASPCGGEPFKGDTSLQDAERYKAGGGSGIKTRGPANLAASRNPNSLNDAFRKYGSRNRMVR